MEYEETLPFRVRNPFEDRLRLLAGNQLSGSQIRSYRFGKSGSEFFNEQGKPIIPAKGAWRMAFAAQVGVHFVRVDLAPVIALSFREGCKRV